MTQYGQAGCGHITGEISEGFAQAYDLAGYLIERATGETRRDLVALHETIAWLQTSVALQALGVTTVERQ